MVIEISLKEGLYYLFPLSFSGCRIHDPNGEAHTHAEFMGILNRTSTSAGKNNSVGNFWCELLIQLLGTARYWPSFTSNQFGWPTSLCTTITFLSFSLPFPFLQKLRFFFFVNTYLRNKK